MKRKGYRSLVTGILLGLVAMASCRKTDKEDLPEAPPFRATPYTLIIPPFFPPMDIPANNPLTVEGIRLGRFLFWEKKLSGDNSMSCGTCHIPDHNFSDPARFSVGITGEQGTRQAMPLINLGWSHTLFWDGRAASLEEQIIEPVENPIEMNESWDHGLSELRSDPLYPQMFREAFGTTEITRDRVTKAMASFIRTMISADSKFDRQRRGLYTFTPMEEYGFTLFITEGGDPEEVTGGQFGADCFHCHGFGGMQMTDYLFHNNGLDVSFENDPGRYLVTGMPSDKGRFKTPTLRNVEFSAPYMHDGRFATLEEVVEHYNSGGKPSETIDPFMKYTSGGLDLSDEAKLALMAFLKCLSDPSFMNNPDFSDPHE